MIFHNPNAELFIPDNVLESVALSRTTHMSIAAHSDDIEIMAYDGILKCYENPDQWFSGVVISNGSSSARDGLYKNYTDDQMMDVRKKEQKKASIIGKYGSLFMLDYTSKEVKDSNDLVIVNEISEILRKTKPEIIYTHNLADKHDTHIGVAIKTIKAVRTLSKQDRPKHLFGCEVWRSLDWLLDSDKILFDVSKNPQLAIDLLTVFESQIVGGKRYDLATLGRRVANATYTASHTVDESQAVIYAMDLTPLIEDDSLNIASYVENYVENVKRDIINKIRKSL